MLDFSPSLPDIDYLNLISISLFFLLIVVVARIFVERHIHEKYTHWTEEQRLKVIGSVRNGSFALLFVGLLYIWGGVLRDFAVSIFAVALAVVVATKEMILCIHGYILILRNSLYHMGDRIEVDGKRGDVTNIGLLATTILEVDPHHGSHQRTGRQVSFPNSVLLNHFIYNESTFEEFTLITISLPMYTSDDWQKAREILLKQAQHECAPYLDAVRRKVGQVQRRSGIELPAVDPRVHIEVVGPENLLIQLRMPCPFHLRSRIEQTIINAYLKEIDHFRIESPSKEVALSSPIEKKKKEETSSKIPIIE